jgi:hypothetical protein
MDGYGYLNRTVKIRLESAYLLATEFLLRRDSLLELSKLLSLEFCALFRNVDPKAAMPAD